ncbi:hypothetical protein KEM48_011001 [Puccinia striiformis f. sp. tritici PST-130]|nr:hypothetical protein KEM48_011001 [Puccinia striiformis f. sp. tritici PST-130]
MSTQSAWPPSLKEFVNQTFARCNDSNRTNVEAELKSLIFEAYKSGRLWTIEWADVQLQTLVPATKRKQNPLTFTAATPIIDGTLMGFLTCLLIIKRISLIGIITLLSVVPKAGKPYLRLTSEPNPADVRPLDVCKKTLAHLSSKWRSESNYNWICDQFKSLRQDLTVQRIKNDFTVVVYETHARIALEKGDLGEFNQCTSQLRQLYKLGLEGHQDEFLAYHILYLIYSRNHSELNELLSSIPDSHKEARCVQHALQVRFAVSTANYRRFFKLFCEAPMMAGFLMDRFIERERIRALAIMARGIRSIPISYLTRLLAFDSEKECCEFLKAHQAYYFESNSRLWDPKPAKDALQQAALKTRKVDIKGQI